MKKIWLLRVTTGRYSDTISWIIRAYTTPKQIAAELDRITKLLTDAGMIQFLPNKFNFGPRSNEQVVNELITREIDKFFYRVDAGVVWFDSVGVPLITPTKKVKKL